LKAVIQRVKRTSLSVDGKLISEIPFGLAVYLGVKTGDSDGCAAAMAGKISKVISSDSSYERVPKYFVFISIFINHSTSNYALTSNGS